MSPDEKFKLITRNLEEVLTEEELKSLIESGTPLKHYIGFEISGKLHLGSLFTLLKVKDLQDAGARTIIWLADLHSAINDKLDGKLETIQKAAKGYFTEAFKALFISIGGNPDKLIFKLCSETYAQNPDFWLTLLEIGKTTTLARTKRSITIMGRGELDDNIPTDKLFYPIMQAADIFLLDINIAHAGLDQRKVHVIARDSANQVKTHALKDNKGNQIKPVAIHHPILLSLTGLPQNVQGEKDEIAMKSKMSKSKAGSGISIHDSPEDIQNKINQAYAPEGIIENNPVLNWTKYLVFYEPNFDFTIKRPEKWGGDLSYSSYEHLEKDYAEKKLHPQDLKAALAEWLIKKLEPVRKYFEDPTKKALLDFIILL
ncbi:tyrosine--tRNA ligase [Candidatus Daviesbacteria bacterium RIFCSPHIGHO2_02_FULL_39_12]|uniref:Tyrosine--tRNA ligase n=2 Tax=Candidatus Daviesiibacteriota TaxID=1752718 RepID=A0A1F5JAA9_9BACT|nr:MAG: tyrosine--tRNA ligase [Candidatus Daviesbacteria bacterium RIFCSPHIGHO2_02_FULL_39_12]OGE71693.1 MAG: tyrosine--tRNA ligase [Candidatus Daviesbacteria bacterium RIFCSPLOWO2_02_FULL_38_15]